VVDRADDEIGQRAKGRQSSADDNAAQAERVPIPGRVTASQFLPPGRNGPYAAPPVEGPAVQASSAASAGGHGADHHDDQGAPAALLPAWVEPQLFAVLSIPVAANDLTKAKQRVNLVLATVRALHRPMRAVLLARFEHPTSNDVISRLFHHQLSHASREHVLSTLRDETPARTESIETKTTAAPAAAAVPKSPMEFGEASREVKKLGRVQAERGVYLLAKPIPGAAHVSGNVVPFDAPVFITKETLQAGAHERWCYVVATDSGQSGFVQEMFIAVDPPDPQSKLHRVEKGETLGQIATKAYGSSLGGGNDQRLYVQGLYEANKDRSGVHLDKVSLTSSETWHRKEAEEETLKVYKGVKVLAGMSIWVPSEAFIQRLKASGAITSGSSEFSKAYRAASDFFNDIVDGIKYGAGFIVGLLDGAYNAIVDLFKGAVDMVEAVLKVIWNLVTGNPGRIKDMLMGWVGKMKLAWEHRGEIGDEFLKKWNAESMWDRGLFQGEVLGWVMMTVLLILVTMGEDAPAAMGGIAARWPQLIKLLKTVDTLGDVTTYLGAAAKAAKLPAKAIGFVAGKVGKAERVAEHVVEDVGKDAGRLGREAGDAERAAGKHADVKDGCFIAGTLVRTAGGTSAIERLRIGTRVVAANTAQGGHADQAIVRTFTHVVPRVIDLHIGSTTITCSPAHPFWVPGQGWVPAGELDVADRLVTASGIQLSIEAVSQRVGAFTVHNISVEGLATYHVSELGILVHNKPMKLDLKAMFDSRKVSLHESIAEIRKRVEKLKKVAKTPESLAAVKKLENDVNDLERRVQCGQVHAPSRGSGPIRPVRSPFSS
jgi:nucleoid-associated protein YgaU